MELLAADLHIHSVLSPCGELSMSPRAIVARAVEVGIQVVALTDHNSARNAPALAAAAQAAGLCALFGLEVRSAEEVDVLTLFDTPADALAYGDWVHAALPSVPCDPALFGDQVVVDGEDEILGFEPHLLINAIEQPLDAVCAEARRRGALVLLAHVDRPANSVLSQLGFMPDDLPVDGVELSRFGDEDRLRAEHPALGGLPVVRFSDAHRPGEIGYQQTQFEVAAAGVTEFRAALEGRGGRRAVPVRRALA
ncbi:MAG: PHP domain-containing protein [Armatimonadetes bacterium]|nr:PHP domain-containing protein [Armatimonadota bacterium]